MDMRRREVLYLGLLTAAGASGSGVVPLRAQQKYPERPVRVVVPFAAGGPTDVTARIIAQGLSERLGEQFYIENISGAGGNTGTAQVARAAPDGMTLIVVSTGFVINPGLYASVPYDPRTDFAPVTIACSSRNVLVVNKDLPAKTAKELVELVKANPAKYSYAQPGTGSTGHLLAEMFRMHFGLDLVNVPFSGAAPALTSTVGGHTPMAWVALPTALPHVRDGNLRMITLSGASRSPLAPDVPTLNELGIDAANSDVLTALLAPSGTPKDIIDGLYREVAAYVGQPEITQKLLALGFEPVANTPEDYAARIDADVRRWANIIRDAGITRIQ